MLLLETTTVIKETMDEYRDFGELIRRLMHPGIFENLIFKIFIRRKSIGYTKYNEKILPKNILSTLQLFGLYLFVNTHKKFPHLIYSQV